MMTLAEMKRWSKSLTRTCDNADAKAFSEAVAALEEAVGLLKAHGRFSSDVDAFLAKRAPEREDAK